MITKTFERPTNYDEKFEIAKEVLANDTIIFGKAFSKFEAAHHDCDDCPMAPVGTGTCLAKTVWPRITVEMIEIIAEWMAMEDVGTW